MSVRPRLSCTPSGSTSPLLIHTFTPMRPKVVLASWKP